MNTTEINGFDIENFNQYDLPVGKKDSICPLCSHNRSAKNQKTKCASLDWERGLGTCHHCDETFQLHTFKRKTDKDWVKPDVTPTFDYSDKVVEFFKSRGISMKTVNDLKISEGKEWMPQFEKEVPTINFNYYINEEIINIKYRGPKKAFKLFKGAEKVFYNLNSIVGHSECIIVEGEMDVCALVESGIRNVISVPNGATLQRLNLDYLDNCIDYFADKSRIIIAVDMDEAGQNLSAEFIRRFGAEVCATVDWGDCKDANDYLLHHGRDGVRMAIDGCTDVPLDNVVTVNDIEDELTEFITEGFKPGYQVGLPNFDSIFSTYTGQFITVTGIPSSGKSDWVDQMAVGYNLNYGWKSAFASPENKPTFLHAHKLIRKYWKGMPSKKDLGGEKWRQVKNHVNENHFFIEMERYDLDSVLDKATELVKRKGIRMLCIDPFNKVKMKTKKDMSINDYTLEYLSKIEVWAKKNDALVVLVAHPTKMYKGADGKIEEPTMYNIKGGGEFYDASYHGLLVHRNYEQKTVKVKVLKVKFQNLGHNGEEAHFSWDAPSGLYQPYEQSKPVTSELPW